jgi:hypothetical protein
MKAGKDGGMGSKSRPGLSAAGMGGKRGAASKKAAAPKASKKTAKKR